MSDRTISGRITELNLGSYTALVAQAPTDGSMWFSLEPYDGQDANTGKWGMARLWRKWMWQTAEFMASRGVTMPLMITAEGKLYGERAFGPEDAHDLFTAQWLGVDKDGQRLSWSRQGRDGMRPATKGERFIAMLKHQDWAIEKGVNLFNPKESEFHTMQREQDGQ